MIPTRDEDVWPTGTKAIDMALGLFSHWMYDIKRKEAREAEAKRLIFQEALDRLGFGVTVVEDPPRSGKRKTVFLGPTSEPITKDQEVELGKMVETVIQEFDDRRKAVEAETARKQAEYEAKKKADYDAQAAPFREQRNRTKLITRAKRAPGGRLPHSELGILPFDLCSNYCITYGQVRCAQCCTLCPEKWTTCHDAPKEATP